MITQNDTLPIRNIEDIRRRKAELKQQLAFSSKGISQEVRTLFARESSISPTKRMTELLSQAGTSIDVALLGWKLYKHFNPSSKKKKKKTKKRKWLFFKKK